MRKSIAAALLFGLLLASGVPVHLPAEDGGTDIRGRAAFVGGAVRLAGCGIPAPRHYPAWSHNVARALRNADGGRGDPVVTGR